MFTRKAFSLIAVLTLTASLLRAEAPVQQLYLANVQGAVAVKSADGSMKAAKNGMAVRAGQTIVTDADESAVLVFSTGSAVTVSEESSVSVDKYTQGVHGKEVISPDVPEPSSSQVKLSMHYGEIVGSVTKLSKNSSFVVETPVGIAGIRGTTFLYQVDLAGGGDGDRGLFACGTGSIQVDPLTGNLVILTGGEMVGTEIVNGRLIINNAESVAPQVLRRIRQLLPQLRRAVEITFGPDSGIIIDLPRPQKRQRDPSPKEGGSLGQLDLDD